VPASCRYGRRAEEVTGASRLVAAGSVYGVWYGVCCMLVYRCGGNRRVLVVAITSAAGVGQAVGGGRLSDVSRSRRVHAGCAYSWGVARAQAAAMVYRVREVRCLRPGAVVWVEM
jgi:hypothetical protein